MSNPTFKIYGQKRRELKKKLNELKSYVRYFWHNHQLEKDMFSFFGSGPVLSDEVAQEKFDKANAEIAELETKLAEKYE